MVIIILILGVILYILFNMYFFKPKPRVLGIYSQPGRYFWLKFCLFYGILFVRRMYQKVLRSTYSNETLRTLDKVRESPQPLNPSKPFVS